ncbi:MAG TPA: hypothetical protein EYG92_05205 [Lutibacter sp.]|nr:hypothetical protein [Lutibacter sp.]
MNSISLSDIQRNWHKLNDFDIVELVDKKRKKFVEKLIEDKKMSKLELLKISGIIDSNNTTTKESLRDERLTKYTHFLTDSIRLNFKLLYHIYHSVDIKCI